MPWSLGILTLQKKARDPKLFSDWWHHCGSCSVDACTPTRLCRPLQVTYRVVQVTDGQLDGQGDTAGAVSVVSTAAFAGGQQAVTQVGVDGAAQRPGPAAASVPPGPAAPFPLVGGQQH